MSEPAPKHTQVETSIPLIHASTIQTSWTSNEWTIALSQFLPNPRPDAGSLEGHPQPVAILQISPQTAKDLYLLMQEGIQEYEKQFGSITTTFSQTKGKNSE